MLICLRYEKHSDGKEETETEWVLELEMHPVLSKITFIEEDPVFCHSTVTLFVPWPATMVPSVTIQV